VKTVSGKVIRHSLA